MSHPTGPASPYYFETDNDARSEPYTLLGLSSKHGGKASQVRVGNFKPVQWGALGLTFAAGQVIVWAFRPDSPLLWLILAAAVAIPAFIAAHQARKLPIRPETPLRYWIDTFSAEARAPRPARPQTTIRTPLSADVLSRADRADLDAATPRRKK